MSAAPHAVRCPSEMATVRPGDLLRIEMVVPSLPVAGLEMVVANLLRSLTRRGHDVGVTCIEEAGPLGERLRDEGYRITVVPTPGLATNFRPTPLLERWQTLKPDVIHVHSGAWMKAAQSARMAGVAAVYTLHGIWPDPPWYIPLYSRLSARRTDRIVAVSESLAQHLRDDIRLDPDGIEVIENGIDTDLFSPAQRVGKLRRALGLDDDVFLVGNIARLHPVKNHELLLAAFARLHRTVPRSALVLIGEGPLREQLEERIRALGLGGAVTLFGGATDLHELYPDLDLFVLSSIIEGTSISALEAMASGVCVAATAVGGNPALLGHGENGRLVPAGNGAALADEMIALAGDAASRRKLAAAGRERAEQHHSLKRMSALYERAYASAIEHASRRTRRAVV